MAFMAFSVLHQAGLVLGFEKKPKDSKHCLHKLSVSPPTRLNSGDISHWKASIDVIDSSRSDSCLACVAHAISLLHTLANLSLDEFDDHTSMNSFISRECDSWLQTLKSVPAHTQERVAATKRFAARVRSLSHPSDHLSDINAEASDVLNQLISPAGAGQLPPHKTLRLNWDGPLLTTLHPQGGGPRHSSQPWSNPSSMPVL